MILLSRLLCCLLVLPLLLPAAERAALVIGVNRYASFPEDKQLSSPVNDAQDVARKLASMGFVVQSPVLDGTRQAILDAKRRFLADASGAQVALFYFSGHGFQVGDENYLIPSDMPSISSFTVLREHAVQLRDSVMAGLEEAGAGTKIIILDCCRDNPFAGQIAAALGTKSLRTKGGGGEISGYGPGFFLAFASSPGAVALDGNGARNSPFTAALLHHLDTEPGANLRDLFDGVKSTVSETNGQDQVPWVNDSLNRQHVKVLTKLSPVTSAPLSLPAMSEAEIDRRALEKAREMAAKMSAESAMRNGTPPASASPQVPAGTKGFTNSLGMTFVPVPGTQVMMCIHETRNADYAVYASAQSGVDGEWRQVAGVGKEQHPVVNVNYEDVEGFCQWLSAKEGKTYRLPTDEEWSVAVGLGEETGLTQREKNEQGPENVFPWGSYYPPKPGDGNYDPSIVDDGYERTAPVMSFRANELGIYDLGGNVDEWCQDWYEVRNWRVLRGASFFEAGTVLHVAPLSDFSRKNLRSSNRSGVDQRHRRTDRGFRCVLLVDEGKHAAPAMSGFEAEKPGRELAGKMLLESSMRNGESPASASPASPQVPAGNKGITNSLGMTFVPVPGTQVMMCIHETRNADYAVYASAQSGVDGGWRQMAGVGKEQHSVVYVNYEDAEAFCRWLSAKEGKTYRLPTDAEWSAAVGLGKETGRTPEEKGSNGSSDVFPWGSYYPPKPEDGNYDTSVVNDGYEKTAPVMSFRANELGVYDLGGNVWEWCQDWYDDSGRTRVLRGASWFDLDRVLLRSAFRFSVRPVLRNVISGFRCVLVVAGG